MSQSSHYLHEVKVVGGVLDDVIGVSLVLEVIGQLPQGAPLILLGRLMELIPRVLYRAAKRRQSFTLHLCF